ncbi:MAG: hypothetical protein H6Q21_1236, partial [Bacteroidetes bacterium]|nr:hypothetical protein [Bacteroidota bacterium]
SGNLARLYAGISYYKMGQYEDAIENLTESFIYFNQFFLP